jgi:small subunit ribosomal protein S18
MPKPPTRNRKDMNKKKSFYKRKTRKACEFCIEKDLRTDYKNLDLIYKYINERGKIKPRRATGCCAKHQRKVTVVVKRAREMALIPYTCD